METRVIKIDGDQVDDESLRALAAYLKRERHGRRLIVVHGGAVDVERWHARLGLPYRKSMSLRVTSDESMDIVAMVLCGLVNKRIVSHLVSAGVPALGVSGVDLGLLQTRFLNRKQLGRVGGSPKIDTSTLIQLLRVERVLVIAPVSLAVEGGLANLSADHTAQAIAVALGATSLDYVTSLSGAWTGLSHRLGTDDISALISSRAIDGSVIPKLQAGVAAIECGVRAVRVGDLKSFDRGRAIEVRA